MGCVLVSEALCVGGNMRQSVVMISGDEPLPINQSTTQGVVVEILK